MTKRLRVGVIGLGRRWQKRYRPALLKLSDRFEVRALCDGVYQRAINEAHRLGCDAVAGPTQLLEGEDIDALLLLDPPWYRLWPLEAACRAGRPVFCCATPEQDEVHADALCRQVQESRLPVMLEMALRFVPATLRLRELLETRLGPARTVLVELIQPAQEEAASDGEAAAARLRNLLGGRGVGLLDWCAHLLGEEPANVLAGGGTGPLTTLLLEFGGGRSAQITHWRAPGARRALRLRVAAERGSAMVEPPARLQWNDEDGRHAHVLPPRQQLGQMLLERFHRTLTDSQAPEPNLADACRVLGWLKAAVRSLAEGQRVALNE
ncbi:MAG TPA: Gfo/Idh/MocA family oxidoreductase [Gemmataceae bacterium]|nr:Gfo/Idh/MocA family oxidoreductase [Gemmataceae bacterium]